MQLTRDGINQHFTLTTFATGFPVTPTPDGGTGPFAAAFTTDGRVLVTAQQGTTASNIFSFSTDTDGQSITSPGVTSVSYSGFNSAFGLAQLPNGSGGWNYDITQQSLGTVVQINSDGTFNQPIVSLPEATAIVPFPPAS